MDSSSNQRPSRVSNTSSRSSQPALSDVPGPCPSSPSVMRNIGTMDITESQFTMHAPTAGAGGAVVSIIVASPDYRQETQETQQSGPTPPRAMVIQHDRPRARSDHEIYHYQLLSKGRGYPLWIPGPGRQLPVEYRRQGVSIGDVGIINQLGIFDFLFNIFQPPDSPIHRRGVPPSFSPNDFEGLEINTTTVYGRNTYLTSESVRTLEINSSDLKFESSAQEAAILTMPEGAATEDLLNKDIIQRCIEENAKDWYEYATGPRGRIIRPGEILGVVVGWDKVRSWGIATSTCTSDQSVSLEFKVGDESGTSRAYRWDCTGSANVRVGPEAEEMSDIQQANGVFPQNQCVFVRTMNFSIAGTLSDDRSLTAFQHTLVSEGGRGSAAAQEGSKGGRKGQRSWFWGRRFSSEHSDSQTRQCVAVDHHRESGVVHPSSWLHEHFLKMYPNATLVITEDEAWTFVLTEEDNGFPEPEDLITRVLESYEVHENGGTVKLSPRYPSAGKKTNTDCASSQQISTQRDKQNRKMQKESGLGKNLGRKEGPALGRKSDMEESDCEEQPNDLHDRRRKEEKRRRRKGEERQLGRHWGHEVEAALGRKWNDMQGSNWEEQESDMHDKHRKQQKQRQKEEEEEEKRMREEVRKRREEEKRRWDNHYKLKEQQRRLEVQHRRAVEQQRAEEELRKRTEELDKNEEALHQRRANLGRREQEQQKMEEELRIHFDHHGNER